MTESPQRGGPNDPNQPSGPYSGYTDPAYAGYSPPGAAYSAAQPPPNPNPTEPLPQYWTQTYGAPPPGTPPEEPEPPGSPRWLWFVAGAAVLLVVGLVAALVIAYSSQSKNVVAPLPTFQAPATTTPPSTTTTPSTPLLPLPLPTLPSLSTPPTSTGEAPSGTTEPVVYQVNGQGRAINITYVGTGSVMQTEFNVALPWQKEVDLPKPASNSASVTVINVGRDITCNITVSGVQVRQRTGAGLTICSAAG